MPYYKSLIVALLGIFVAAASVLYWKGDLSAAYIKRDNYSIWGPNSDWYKHWRAPNMSPWHTQRVKRHWHFMHGNIPDKYRNLNNPHDYTAELYTAGAKIYAKNCAQCHGRDGLGGGEAGKDLSPSPSLLAFLIQRPIAVDEYLTWTISEGGKAFGTDMPAFENELSRDDIWKVIAYMRAGFPYVNEDEKK